MARNHWSDALVFGSLFFKQEDYYNIVLNYMVCEGYQKAGNPMFTLLATLTDSSQAILSFYYNDTSANCSVGISSSAVTLLFGV